PHPGGVPGVRHPGRRLARSGEAGVQPGADEGVHEGAVLEASAVSSGAMHMKQSLLQHRARGARRYLWVLPAAALFMAPAPTSVTITGTLQSELGCSGDNDPACAATHLAYSAANDKWTGTFTVPAGSYTYTADLN